VSRYQKGKTDLDFTEARDSEWQWHQLGHMQVCISLQTDNHASTPPLKCFFTYCTATTLYNNIIAEVSGEIREGSFLFQRLSVLVQRFNAVLLHDCFVDEVAGHSS